jgi:hypothetical protein
VAALAKADLDDPYLAVEAVLGDIKRAIELEDRSLGGLVDQRFERGRTRPFEREEGSTAVGVIVPYIVPYYESWGAP